MTLDEVVDNRIDLLTFTKTMFKAKNGTELIENWHQELICNALEKVVAGHIKNLIINICPRSGKTELAVINFIAWCMGNFPDSEFIHSSYSKRLATANTYAVRALMQDEVYQQIFDHTQLSGDSQAKDEFRTAQGGCVYATGADGTITGFGSGKMRSSFGGATIIDDPHKAGEFNSQTMRQNVLDWFSTTIESRKNSPHTPMIVIMQRGHENDLSGFLLEGGNGEDWYHVKIPVINYKQESFWVEQFPDVRIEQLKKSNSYVFAGQYMQNPAPIGGGTFKEEWWKYYKVLPHLQYRKIFADTALKTKEENDYSVFQCWGYDSNKNCYLIDQVRGKWEAPELLKIGRAFWDKHKSLSNNSVGVLRKMVIEDKASGTGLIQTLKRGGEIPIEAKQRNIDKITRSHDGAPMIESGFVFLPESSEWLSDYLHEFRLFPNAKHDDQVDPTLDAIDEIINKSNTRNWDKMI